MSEHEFEPRRAKPGETFEEVDEEGTAHTFAAAADGVVRPRNRFEEAVCDHHDLPVARKAVEADKSPAKGGKD